MHAFWLVLLGLIVWLVVRLLPGTVASVSLTNMGGPMMDGQGNAMMGVGAMGPTADHASVPHGPCHSW